MNELQIFENSEFGRIRVLTIQGEPWFVAADVCRALAIKNGRDALSRLDDDERMTVGSTDGHSGQRGGAQQYNIVNEPGLYTLILGSRKPEAKAFKRWITHEILPSIRKYGAYIPDELLDAPEALQQLCEALLEERRKNAQLTQKAVYFDRFVASGYSTNLRTTAKELDIPEKKFVQFLLDQHFLYRSPSGTLLPYSKQEYKALFVVRDFCRNGYAGAYTLVTPEGKRYFASLRDGILAI